MLRLAASGPGPYSRLGEEAIISDALRGIAVSERFYVDIGAGDGVSQSNTYALARAGWPGLSVEADGPSFAALAGAYQVLPGVKLARVHVEPGTVVNVLAAADVPQSFAVLNVDIDGYDYFVLDALLDRYRPAVACVEINEKIPPPVKFTVLYRADYPGPRGHFYGQSISQLEMLIARHGYDLIGLEYNNAFIVPSELNPVPALSADETYRAGYRDRPDRLTRFPWNQDMEALLELTPSEAVAAIHSKFADYRGEYLCEL